MGAESKRANTATIRQGRDAGVKGSGVSQIVDGKPFKAYVWGGTGVSHGIQHAENQVTSGRVGRSSQSVDGGTD